MIFTKKKKKKRRYTYWLCIIYLLFIGRACSKYSNTRRTNENIIPKTAANFPVSKHYPIIILFYRRSVFGSGKLKRKTSRKYLNSRGFFSFFLSRYVNKSCRIFSLRLSLSLSLRRFIGFVFIFVHPNLHPLRVYNIICI